MGRLCISRFHPQLEDIHDEYLTAGVLGGGDWYMKNFPYIDVYASTMVSTIPPTVLTSPFVPKAHPKLGLLSCEGAAGVCISVWQSEWEPLAACQLRGRVFPCPRLADAVVARMYGKAWRTPEADDETQLPNQRRPMKNPTDHTVSHMVLQWVQNQSKSQKSRVPKATLFDPECMMSDWLSDRQCSMPCLKGILTEHRYRLQPLSKQAHTECPRDLSRTIRCGPDECMHPAASSPEVRISGHVVSNVLESGSTVAALTLDITTEAARIQNVTTRHIVSEDLCFQAGGAAYQFCKHTGIHYCCGACDGKARWTQNPVFYGCACDSSAVALEFNHSDNAVQIHYTLQLMAAGLNSSEHELQKDHTTCGTLWRGERIPLGSHLYQLSICIFTRSHPEANPTWITRMNATERNISMMPLIHGTQTAATQSSQPATADPYTTAAKDPEEALVMFSDHSVHSVQRKSSAIKSGIQTAETESQIQDRRNVLIQRAERDTHGSFLLYQFKVIAPPPPTPTNVGKQKWRRYVKSEFQGCKGRNEICMDTQWPCSTATTLEHCLALCKENKSCISISWRGSTNNCRLSTTCTNAIRLRDKVTDGWSFYEKVANGQSTSRGFRDVGLSLSFSPTCDYHVANLNIILSGIRPIKADNNCLKLKVGKQAEPYWKAEYRNGTLTMPADTEFWVRDIDYQTKQHPSRKDLKNKTAFEPSGDFLSLCTNHCLFQVNWQSMPGGRAVT